MREDNEISDEIITFVEEKEIHQENSNPTYSIVDEEQNNTPTELKLSVKKALLELRCKLEDAILGNHLFDENFSPGKSPDGKTHKSYCCGKSCLLHVKAIENNINDIYLWGIPLLSSKAHEGTDVVLLKFLRARDFKVCEAFDMLRKTLKWRKEFKTEGILQEHLGSDLDNVTYINNTDKEGHPLCYNIYGAFSENDLYQKNFGTEDKCKEYLRWRIQFMEKVIQKLNFKAGGVDSMVEIRDLKNSPGPVMKELHCANKKADSLIQDNYPEFFLRIIFINVPFWYFAYHKVFSRILTQKTRSKFIFARPSKVAKTLLKFIAPENIPVQYGGLKRENDCEFSSENRVTEFIVKAGAIESIQIPVVEAGVTLVWDVTVVGWDVNYKEEFIPDDECSYRILIQKEQKMGSSIRNSFYISEPGKVLLTIDNGTFKKKRVLYRSKTKPTIPMYILLND